MSGTDVFADVATITPQRVWDGVRGRVVHGAQIPLAVVELDAGSVIPEHSHVNEQVGVLLEGSLTFRIGDESRELQAGVVQSVLEFLERALVVGDRTAKEIVITCFVEDLAKDDLPDPRLLDDWPPNLLSWHRRIWSGSDWKLPQ